MDLTTVFISGFFFLTFYKVCELFVRKKERMAIVEKLGIEGNSADLSNIMKLPNFGKKENSFWSLRIALLMASIGVGIIIAFFTVYCLFGDTSNLNMDNWAIRNNYDSMRATIYLAFTAFFGGIGLLIAYFIERKEIKKGEK
ncbi:MAG: hypothetical protein FWD60_03305 [Candidatus Azobacteroides sp.]|nr:hypothetical protein [Candidatus Azobacteroides sp.]